MLWGARQATYKLPNQILLWVETILMSQMRRSINQQSEIMQNVTHKVEKASRINLSELAAGQYAMSVKSYDSYFDTFAIELHDASPSAGQQSLVPAALLPVIVGEFGEPDEFVGQTYLVTQPGF